MDSVFEREVTGTQRINEEVRRQNPVLAYTDAGLILRAGAL